MPLTVTYNLPADQCPAIQLPTTVRNPKADPATPLISHEWVTGVEPAMALYLNQDNREAEGIGRYGAGLGYAIGEGLNIFEAAATGLTLNIGPGVMILDAIVVKVAPTGTPTIADTLAIPNSTNSWIWLLYDGSPVAITGIAPPSGEEVTTFLGRVTASGGNLTAIDKSGVPYRRGGVLYRKTGDIGKPVDTPSNKLQFVNESSDSYWWWNGTIYTKMMSPASIGHAELERPYSRHFMFGGS